MRAPDPKGEARTLEEEEKQSKGTGSTIGTARHIERDQTDASKEISTCISPWRCLILSRMG